jgi:tRNA threonylcarbamoyladenosine biosynthesis protein TsaE
MRIKSLEEMQAFAEDFAKNLQRETAVFLNAPMGAGKTTFTAFLAQSLEIKERVVSPTFTIGHQYTSGRIPLLHIDAYRIITAASSTVQVLDELEALDIETALKNGVVVFEWCEQIAAQIAPKRVEIEIAVDENSADRIIEVHNYE